MFSLDINLEPVNGDLVDPAYATRRQWLERHAAWEATPSSVPFAVGRLVAEKTFSRPMPGISKSARVDLASGGQFGVEIDRDHDKVRYVGLPDKVAQFGEALTRIAAHEHAAYPDAVYAHVGITVDQTKVLPGGTQRGDQIHRDGYPNDPRWAHIYVVSDSSPTEFITNAEGFVLPEPLTESGFEVVSGRPYDVMFSNVTSFHRSGYSPDGSRRTFLRVGYWYDLSAEA